MRLFTIVLALCLVAFASATCLSKLDSSFIDATSGSTDVTLGDTAAVTDASSCKALLAGFAANGTQQCCSADALLKLATIGGNIKAALDQAVTKFQNGVASIDLATQLDPQTQDAINKVPKLKQLYDRIVAAINTFKKNAPNSFERCILRVENYVAGALCSICRPDFVPAILTVDNSTGVVKRRWRWAAKTCDGLSDSCSGFWGDVDSLLISFYDAVYDVVTDPQFAAIFNGSDFTTEFPNRDAIRPCVQMARQIEGNNADITKACRTAICYGVVRGLRTPAVFSENEFGAIEGFAGGLNGGKRNGATDFSSLVGKFTSLSKAFRSASTSAKRQSSAGDSTTYDGTVDANAVGGSNTVGVGGNAVPGSAAGRFVSAFAALVVVIAMMF